VSKNISNLSGRIGLKDNLFKQISENTLSEKPQDIKEIAKKHNLGVSTLHGAESFYEFLRPSHREKKAFVCNGSACMCAGTQEKLKDTLKEKHSMDDSNIAMASINLVIGNKAFFVNEDDSWIHKQNNIDRNRSNRNINNRMRNSNRRNNYQNDSFETYKFNFGKFDGVRVANIISSICNSTNINGRSIGKIQIFNDYSLVDLPRDLHRETKNKLKKIKVRN